MCLDKYACIGLVVCGTFECARVVGYNGFVAIGLSIEVLCLVEQGVLVCI